MTIILEFFFGLAIFFYIGYLISLIIKKLFHIDLYFEEEKKNNIGLSKR